MTANNTVILIPALEPEEKMIALVQDLMKLGMTNIVIVDDGSSTAYRYVFAEAENLGCVVVHHETNKGKGAAIRTGIRTALERFPDVRAVVTADADGQHLPEDIDKVRKAVDDQTGELVLGTRDFTSENVPGKSRFGNRVSAVFFKLSTGIDCPDTQTGLRGIPKNLFRLALEESGDRYEYEMNFLSDAVNQTKLKMIPIQTVYEDSNSKTHFRVVRDSIRVYGRPLRYSISSLIGAASDYALFYIFLRLFSGILPQTRTIFAATALARIGSGLINFTLNKNWSFASRKSVGGEALRYFILFVAQMCTSAGLVSLLAWIGLPAIVAKLIVDTCLFFVSYQIQKRWVFRKG